jgi:hypothetical protein
MRRRFFYTGEPCRNGHVAPSKVKAGCIICLGLSKARAEVRLQERIALRELEREGRVGRPKPLVRGSAEVRVLIAIAERRGVLTQAELVAPGMSKTIVSRAIRSLRGRQLIETVGRATSVTLPGWIEAKGHGASVTFRRSDWQPVRPQSPATPRPASTGYRGVRK